MNYFKGQTVFEFINLQVVLILITIVVIGVFFYYFSTTSKTIQNTNFYNIYDIYFYPAPSQLLTGANILGNVQMSVSSLKTINFSNSYLIQTLPTSVTGFSTNCKSLNISAFSSNSFYCISLGTETSSLAEGNGEYLLIFNNVFYNTTAFDSMNTTELPSISEFVTYKNGRYEVEKLATPVPVQID